MTARKVHAVLAAGAYRPDLIARWQKDPQLLLNQGLEPGSIDLSALWKFAGLTVKVRHNGIRQELPMTFRLMNLAGFEIELFASYATSRASKGQPYAATPADRARDLIAFLEQWLDLGATNHSLLWDMIRHEHALATLAKSVSSTPLPLATDHPGPSRGALSASSVPLVRGEIILHEMRCDPRAVESALFQRPPPLNQIPLGTRHFCYWRPATAAEIRILELDEFGFYALSFVDGVHSAAELSRQLGGSRRPTRRFLRLLSLLEETGILGFQPASEFIST